MGFFDSLMDSAYRAVTGNGGGGYDVPEHRRGRKPAGMSDSEWRKANYNFDRAMSNYRKKNGMFSDNSFNPKSKSWGPGGRR